MTPRIKQQAVRRLAVAMAVAALPAIWWGCQRSDKVANHRLILPRSFVEVTDPSEREMAELKYVRLEGVVANTKHPAIAGVDVEMPSRPTTGSAGREGNDLRNQRAWAEGILLRIIVVPEQSALAQNRGVGAFYELVDPWTGHLAVAYPLTATTRPSVAAPDNTIIPTDAELADLVRDAHGDEGAGKAVAISRLLPCLERSMSRAGVERWLGKPGYVLSGPDISSYYRCTLGVMSVEYELRDGNWMFARVAGPHSPE